MSDNNDSFFSRWSQRKAESRELNEAGSEVREEELNTSTDTDEAQIEALEAEVPQLTDEDMPPLENLDESSDFAQFFSPGVSEELRNLALRKLFLLPEFNLRDGLNDYDDDFSKMPELTEAVVAKLRSWVNDKSDEVKDQLVDELHPTNGTSSQQDAVDAKKTNEELISEIDDDELDTDDGLGDADLDG